MCFLWRKVNGWIVDPAREIAEAERLGRRAVELGPDDAVALSGGGYALVFVAHDLNDGPTFIERALALNPNLAWALFSSGWTKAFLGDPEGAIAQLTHAIQLSPLDPHGFRAQGDIASLTFLLADTQKRSHGRKLHCGSAHLSGRRSRIGGRQCACRADSGSAKGHGALAPARPGKASSTVKDWVPLRRPDDLRRLEEGLRLAGLPE